MNKSPFSSQNGKCDLEFKELSDIVPLSRRRRKWVSRDVSHFKQVEQVGEGTYGYVVNIIYITI